MTILLTKNYNTLVKLIFVLISIITFGCNNRQQQNINDNKTTEKRSTDVFELISPHNNSTYKVSDTIAYKLKTSKNISIDSIHIVNNDGVLYKDKSGSLSFKVNLVLKNVGYKELRIIVFFNNTHQTIFHQLVFLSDKLPKQLKYKVVQKLEHNTEFYTQGFEYKNGFIYEGTGQYGKSGIFKINVATGNIVQNKYIDGNYFGEGISIMGEKLYQITYKKGKGFIYNLEDFSQVGSFDLQTQEGWGLTNDGNYLIQSDGSARLSFYDPTYYSFEKELYVADNDGLVANLNELEYENGRIWANIYGEKHIAQIDPSTGKVIAYLDLSGLFTDNIPEDLDHVLNGIAYNPDNKTFFITGKYWPLIYEISVEQPFFQKGQINKKN